MKKCKVKTCRNDVQHVSFDGYSLDVRPLASGNGWSLVGICIDKPFVKEITIPKVLPTGHVINLIYDVENEFDYAKDAYKTDKMRHLNKLIFDDEISEIMIFALCGLDVGEVHWPMLCKKIPEQCFKRSRIEKLTGIEEVSNVEPFAFIDSDIKSIKWPQSCRSIPEGCFLRSGLETIDGIGVVDQIGDGAFASSNLKGISFPQPYCLIEQSAFYGCDPKTISFPYYATQSQREESLSGNPAVYGKSNKGIWKN